MRDSWCHVASVMVTVDAQSAFSFMQDGQNLGKWALGCWGGSIAENDLYYGHSLFDGKLVNVSIEPDCASLTVSFAVSAGARVGARTPRIIAKVIEGQTLGVGSDKCLITLIAWRHSEMSDSRWNQLCVSHETEVLMIRHLVETKSRSINAKGED